MRQVVARMGKFKTPIQDDSELSVVGECTAKSQALQELLQAKKFKIKKSTLERFLEECDSVTPWFAVSGNLTVPSWEKLGRDLDFAYEQGTLRAGVRPVWKLVRGCLEDQRCSDPLECGNAALEQLQEERSEKVASEKGASGEKSLYPNLDDFEFSEFPQMDSEQEEEGMSSEEELLAAWLRACRSRQKQNQSSEKKKRKSHVVTGAVEVSDLCLRHRLLIPTRLKNKAILSIQRSGEQCEQTCTWLILFSKILKGKDIRAFLVEYASAESAANLAASNGIWDRDTLLRLGRFANNQTGYPPEVYQQVNKIGIKAWKSLPNKGEDSERFAFTLPSINHEEPDKRFKWVVLPQGASNIFTDGSKTGTGAYMIDSQAPVQHYFSPGAPQKVELLIVIEVFKACPFPFNLISDSCYVVNAVNSLECAGPIKSSNTTLKSKFAISRADAHKVVLDCQHCVQFHHPPSIGVNLRGLLPLRVWQMDVTHISESGRLKSQDPIWVPERLVWKATQNCQDEDASMDDDVPPDPESHSRAKMGNTVSFSEANAN
ncbi:hypothetical protein STEG23_012675 [Scotinomys teguina]